MITPMTELTLEELHGELDLQRNIYAGSICKIEAGWAEERIDAILAELASREADLSAKPFEELQQLLVTTMESVDWDTEHPKVVEVLAELERKAVAKQQAEKARQAEEKARLEALAATPEAKRVAFAQSMLNATRYDIANRQGYNNARDLKRWEAELAEALRQQSVLQGVSAK